MAAWAVDREFVNIYLVPLASLGATWGSIWVPLGSIWVPLGSIRLPLGVHLGAFGVPLGLLGPLGGALGRGGSYSQVCSKLGPPIPARWLPSMQPADKI